MRASNPFIRLYHPLAARGHCAMMRHRSVKVNYVGKSDTANASGVAPNSPHIFRTTE